MSYRKGKFPDLTAILARKASKASEEKILTITKIAQEVSDKQQADFFNTLTLFMGQYNKPQLKTFEKVVWRRLSRRTIDRKRKLGRKKSGLGRYSPAGKWYSHLDASRGEVSLRDFLKGEPVEKYYGTTDFLVTKWDSLKQKDYWKRIIIVPGLSRGRKPFTDDDNTMGMNRQQETKVTAKNEHTGLSNEEARPLFSPMAEYFVRIRIPRAINRKLKERGYNVKF